MSIAATVNSNTQLQEGVEYKIKSSNDSIWMSLDRAYAAFESPLDTLGYVPFVGTLSSVFLRAPYAQIQLTVGVVGLVVESTITGLCLATLQIEAGKRHLGSMGHCIKHISHSALNDGRCFVEGVPFLPWILCIPYDLAGKILSYPGALEDRKVTVVLKKNS